MGWFLSLSLGMCYCQLAETHLPEGLLVTPCYGRHQVAAHPHATPQQGGAHLKWLVGLQVRLVLLGCLRASLASAT